MSQDEPKGARPSRDVVFSPETASVTQPFPTPLHPFQDPEGILVGVEQQMSMQVWQGQFMPPEAIERLERLHPGTWSRMLMMAEQAQTSQIENVKQVNKNVRGDKKRGQWLGWSATVIAMGCALACGLTDHPGVAALFLSLTVGSVIKSIIDGKAQPTTGTAVATTQDEDEDDDAPPSAAA